MQTSPKLRRTLWTLLGFLALDACAAAPPPESEPTQARGRRQRAESDEDYETAQNGATQDTAGSATSPPQTGSSPSSGDQHSGGPGGDLDNGRTGAPAASIGTPAAGASQEAPLTPRWRVQDGHGRILCEGALDRASPYCPQCPAEPSNASIVRTFVPIEREVLECEPPSNEDGRLAVRADFSGAGMPIAISFPGVHLRRRTAVCMGQAFCRMRMPTLRSPEATVNYEYVVLLPATPQPQ